MSSSKLKVYDLKLIRLLAVIQTITLIIVIVISSTLGFLSLPNYIFGGIFLIETLLQIGFILSSKGTALFNEKGVEIKKRKFHKFYKWEFVKGLFYNSIGEFFPLLNHLTLELLVEDDGKVMLVNDNYGGIKCTKKKYKQIISLIPIEILEKNEFMLYRNIVEKQKYNLHH